MKNKVVKLVSLLLISLSVFGCGGTSTNENIENTVKIKSIKSVNGRTTELNLKKSLNNEERNYVAINNQQTELQFTITLDNPEAFGIDALKVMCTDPDAYINVEGLWKPIAQEADGTRIVNWSSEDPYEKTYSIQINSQMEYCLFKVVDIRLVGQEQFLSKTTNSNDFGNNELDIYKFNTNVLNVEILSDNIKETQFKISVKEGVTNVSNIQINGEGPNEDGTWIISKNLKRCYVTITYDIELPNGEKISWWQEEQIGNSIPAAWKEGETNYIKTNCSVNLMPNNGLILTTYSALDYIEYDEVLCIDLRGDSEGYSSGHILGFESISFFKTLVGEDEQLFYKAEDKFVPRYDNSVETLEKYFPKNKIIFAMCQSGARIKTFCELLNQYGYDMSMVYNVGGWNDVRNYSDYGGYEVVLPQ